MPALSDIGNMFLGIACRDASMPILTVRSWLLAAILSCPITYICHAQQVDGPEAWLKDLASQHFWCRELASQKLLRAGKEAIPAMEQAITGIDSDGVERIIRVLSELAVDPDSLDGTEAVDALRRIAQSSPASSGILANRALQSLGDHQRDIVEYELIQLGAESGFRDVQIVTSLSTGKYRLRLDNKFQGNAGDLKRLQWLYGIDHLQVDGPQVNGEWLEQIARMPNLKILQISHATLNGADLEKLKSLPRIETLEILYTKIDDQAVQSIAKLPVEANIRIFGTKMTEAGMDQLRLLLSDVDIIFGRGGYLGVQMQPSGDPLVTDVVSGGAAQKAGIQRGDRILTINDRPIKRFEDLRQELSHYGPDETVQIRLTREFNLNERRELVLPVVLGEQIVGDR